MDEMLRMSFALVCPVCTCYVRHAVETPCNHQGVDVCMEQQSGKAQKVNRGLTKVITGAVAWALVWAEVE